ncbi:hypothetical protein MP228_003866 [Amoeboaphelidium protococcarum]|nr:hypothetical protein MP228_003866 [Amoeboaphelidium protococcarum]
MDQGQWERVSDDFDSESETRLETVVSDAPFTDAAHLGDSTDDDVDEKIETETECEDSVMSQSCKGAKNSTLWKMAAFEDIHLSTILISFVITLTCGALLLWSIYHFIYTNRTQTVSVQVNEAEPQCQEDSQVYCFKVPLSIAKYVNKVVAVSQNSLYYGKDAWQKLTRQLQQYIE